MNWENLLVPELICGEKGVTLYLKPKRNLNLCLQRFYLRYDETTYSLELEMKGKTNLERINNILVQKDKKQLLKTCFEVFLDHLNYWPSSDVWIKKIRKNSLLFEQWLKEYGNNFIFGVVLCENTFLKQEGVMDKTKKICRMTKNWNTTLGFLEVEESNVYALLFVLLLSLKCEKKEINKLIIEESVLLQRLNLINSEKNRRTLRENFNVLVSLRVGTVSRKKMRSAILIYDFKVEKLEKKTIYSLNFYDEAVNLISRTNKLLKVDIFESLDNWRKTKKLKIRKNTLLTLFLEMLSSTMMSKMSKKSLPPDYRTTKNYFEIIEELSTDFLPSVLNIEIPKIEKRNLERIVINFQNTKYIFPKQPEE